MMAPGGQNPKVISTLVVVFLAGAAVGALGMQLGLHDKLHRTAAAASKPVPLAAKDAVLQRFKTELNLTPAQTQQISSILDDYRHYYQSLQDQLDDVRAMGKTRIVQILDDQQRQKFDKMMSELQAPLEAK
jgi:Spy/CpxP family protein refolding chaperone